MGIDDIDGVVPKLHVKEESGEVSLSAEDMGLLWHLRLHHNQNPSQEQRPRQ